MGHVICSRGTFYINDLWFNIIYSFHLPLFFLISGYVLYRKDYRNLSSLTKTRMFHLIVPMVMGCALALFVNPYLTVYREKILEYLYLMFVMNHISWILWTLFTCFICLLPLYNCKSDVRFWVYGISILILTNIIPFIFYQSEILRINSENKNWFGMSQNAWYIIFFFIGLVISRYIDVFVRYRWGWTVFGAIMFILSMMSTGWEGGWVKLELGSPLVIVKYYGFEEWMVRFFQAIGGSAVILGIVMILSKFKISDFFGRIGELTLGIYLFSGFLITYMAQLDIEDGIFRIVLISLFSLFGSILITLLMKRIKIMDLLFLGNINAFKKNN